jgi:2-hydroxy-6-oxonona-2,4-dienedioate hydrolase
MSVPFAVAATLKKHWTNRTWALDLIGHGWSDLSDHDLEIDEYVDLLGFLDEMGIQRASLVGVSLGGSVASRFAIVHPDRVRALVTPGGSQADRKVMNTVRSTTTAAVVSSDGPRRP